MPQAIILPPTYENGQQSSKMKCETSTQPELGYMLPVLFQLNSLSVDIPVNLKITTPS
jgi:hypothetical protein